MCCTVVSHSLNSSSTFPSVELKTHLLGPSALQWPLTVISIVYIKTPNYVSSWEEEGASESSKWYQLKQNSNVYWQIANWLQDDATKTQCDVCKNDIVVGFVGELLSALKGQPLSQCSGTHLASAKLKNSSLTGWLNCVKATPVMSSSSGSSQPIAASILLAAPILQPIIPPSIITSPIDIDILPYLPPCHVLLQWIWNLSASLPLSVPS